MHLLDKVIVLRDIHRELRLGVRKEGLFCIPIDLSDVQDQGVSEHWPGDNAKCGPWPSQASISQYPTSLLPFPHLACPALLLLLLVQNVVACLFSPLYIILGPTRGRSWQLASSTARFHAFSCSWN
ncbi:hypothetical protein B0H14DRAFT_3452387 [Mycena olivaceomarginata]|nr:hypothetical protein B0H14DRAFT_3452387 [Mycena olivaceomarginata]